MKKLATQVIHEGYSPEPLAGCVAPPIYMSTTYAQEEVGKHNGYEYARSNNPTREMLENNVSALERCRCYSLFDRYGCNFEPTYEPWSE